MDPRKKGKLPKRRRLLTVSEKKRKIFLIALEECGQVNQAASIAGYSSSAALRAYRAKDEEFAKAWDVAESVAFDILEDEAHRRAVEGVMEPVFHQGEIVGHRVKYSDALLTTLLKANNPDKYRDNIKVDQEVKGNFGVAILPSTHTSALDWESRAAIVHESQDALMSDVDDKPDESIIDGEYEEEQNTEMTRG